QDRPYHVLHFDGHGDYIEQRGWISFEYPDPDEDGEIVNGDRLGKLMQESGVPILVLNACRSAYAEFPNAPIQKEESRQARAHSEVHAFGSLAQEVANWGVIGVVAMRYAVYAVTASKFIADFYDALVQGLTLGDAVGQGRKKLYDQPIREIAFGSQKIQDWSIPVVYGPESLVLFPEIEGGKKSAIKTKEARDMSLQGWIDQALPACPDSGFFGMDETIHAIDRAFDSQKVVLLYGFAGSGKTATAAEFARWYSLTGGVKGPILFTSFERHITLPHVLDKIGIVFRKKLEHRGITWLALDDTEKRDVALEILRQEPILWIWDNIEPVSGFPSGNKSLWSETEQNELADFLRLARDTQAKILLTSRRDESSWLGEISSRVAIRPMHIFETIELAKARMNEYGYKIVEMNSWMPLLEYTQGNPLTITVLVGQALRENLSTKEQIKKYVEMLMAGETEIQDDERSGRSKSLSASLSYGFQHAFDDSEREIIALLYFFQGLVNVEVLRCILDPGAPWHIKDLRSPTSVEVIKLLDRASEVGLLKALDGGYYSVHPVLPWYFKKLFDHYYKGREDKAVKAF
ncbi:MAG: CHAT domain-containing protein, partial [Methanotrichaceae archaeon]